MNEVRLPPEQHEAIYKLGILAPSFRTTTRADSPMALFVGGQPGCGKSTVARTARSWFAQGNYVHVDVDRLRELHPHYLPLVGNPQTERLAPSAVQKDCSRWADMLRESAALNGRNLLLESSMRVPEQFRDSVRALRESGHRVEVRIIAVHEKASEVSLAQRFEHEKRALGYGREIPPEYHDLAAPGVLNTLRLLEAEKLADHVVVLDRAGNTIFENRLFNGEWANEPNGAKIMDAFRVQSYDLAEKQKIAGLWADVVDMMALRGAQAEELAYAKDKSEQAQVIATNALAVPHGLSIAEASSDATGLCEGDYNGRILEHRSAGNLVVQKIGRDPERVAIHSCKLLTRIPDVGEVVDIKYRAGVGQVSERPLEAQISR